MHEQVDYILLVMYQKDKGKAMCLRKLRFVIVTAGWFSIVVLYAPRVRVTMAQPARTLSDTASDSQFLFRSRICRQQSQLDLHLSYFLNEGK